MTEQTTTPVARPVRVERESWAGVTTYVLVDQEKTIVGEYAWRSNAATAAHHVNNGDSPELAKAKVFNLADRPAS
jgi:CRISPR/Cas system CMR subunit Cmr4 (Cas7 group RAMP superfamily)